MNPYLFAPTGLEAAPEHVAAMPRADRENRVHALIEDAHNRVKRAAWFLIEKDNRKRVAMVLMFSGGNDSTVLAHLFKDYATHAMHANTLIGIEKTREFVRATCRAWKLPLIEEVSPRAEDRYDRLVMEEGFPGPAQHFKMQQRLKGRVKELCRNMLVKNPFRERVLFLGGRRRTESDQRMDMPEMDRIGSMAHVSPLYLWTKPDLTTYRALNPDCPRNPVADLIHMSGECLCGAYATKTERAEIEAFFPGTFDGVKRLEMALDAAGTVPECRRRWGWGADLDARAKERLLKRAARGATMCGAPCMQRFLFDSTSSAEGST